MGKQKKEDEEDEEDFHVEIGDDKSTQNKVDRLQKNHNIYNAPNFVMVTPELISPNIVFSKHTGLECFMIELLN